MSISGMESSGVIITRYKTLSAIVKGYVQDYCNTFILLKMIAYGNSQQQKFGFDDIKTRIKTKDLPIFGPIRGDLKNTVVESLERTDGKFSRNDLNHLMGLERLVNYANEQAVSGALTSTSAKEIYALLIPYWYGKLTI